MSKMLIVDGVLTPHDNSNTMILVDEFLKEYKLKNPNDKIDILNLNKSDIRPIDMELYSKIGSGEENIAKKYAREFLEYDKIVFAAPMWNLSIPAIVKAYIDYISYAGITFKYTENGPVGLVENSKALLLTSSGGIYSKGHGQDLEMASRYMKIMLEFLGISDYQSVSFEGSNFYLEHDLKKAKNIAIKNAKKIAETF